MVAKGIDVSHYQTDSGPIDFAAVKGSGVTFVMVRAGWCGYEGEMHFDANLERTLRDANAAGMDVGVYVYSYAMSAQAAERAAQETIGRVSAYRLTYPVAFDVEDERLIDSLSRAQITGTVRAFCEAVRELKYYPMFYTYVAFAQQHLEMEELDGYAFWVADYAAQNQYEGEYGIWQYSGSGTCPGVTGPCDLDLSYQDYPQIIAQAGLNGLQPPAPAPAPAPNPPGWCARLRGALLRLFHRIFPFL